MPEGTNSHTFDPPPQVAATMEKADIVFVNGLQLEEPTFQLAEENAQNATIVKIGDTVLPESEYIYDFSFPKEDGKPNPHLWTDPTYAIKYAGVIKDTVVAKDPANADYYTTNYEAFVAKATALSDALKADQATVPAGGLELLTYHDAYAYFAKTYGWKVIGAVQPSNFEDPQPKEIAAPRRPDQGREGARHLRLRGLPLQGAGADRQGDRRALRGHPARRRPARRTGRRRSTRGSASCATTTSR